MERSALTPPAAQDAAAADPAVRAATRPRPRIRIAAYLLLGTLFGVVLVKAQVVSWYRIQEMFRFQSFHMFGVIGSAVVVAGATTWALRRAGARTLDGERLHAVAKGPIGIHHLLGGVVFGLGWAATGACPGPVLALVGAGLPAFAVVLFAATAGTACYGLVRHRLPHG